MVICVLVFEGQKKGGHGVGGGYCGLTTEDENNNKLPKEFKGKFTGEFVIYGGFCHFMVVL